MLAADTLLDHVYATLDDLHRVHTVDAGIALRALSRAQQWVAIRYRLLRATIPVTLGAGIPLYPRLDGGAQAVTVLSASLNGTPLAVVPLHALRVVDPAWLKTSGTPTLLYCVRWSLWGFYPVPSASGYVLVGAVMAPIKLTTLTQRLEIPDAYADQVLHVTTGLLLCTREGALQDGVAYVQRGLNLGTAASRPLAGQVA